MTIQMLWPLPVSSYWYHNLPHRYLNYVILFHIVVCSMHKHNKVCVCLCFGFVTDCSWTEKYQNNVPLWVQYFLIQCGRIYIHVHHALSSDNFQITSNSYISNLMTVYRQSYFSIARKRNENQFPLTKAELIDSG